MFSFYFNYTILNNLFARISNKIVFKINADNILKISALNVIILKVMRLKKNYIYIIIAFIFIFILAAAGFMKYLPSAAKTSALLKKSAAVLPELSEYNSSRLLSPPICKGERFNAQQSGQTVFYCTVKYLQYLRYLPVSFAGPDKYKFSFTVPDILHRVADSYEWNPQNPFILGAAAQYLKASGKLRGGEYARPKIDGALLSELKESAANGKFDSNPWKWVLVRQADKNETVELYENGKEIFSSPANTGEFATTPDGTWYVFLRYNDTTMSGLSPKRITTKMYESLKAKHPGMVACLDGHPIKWVAYDDSGIKYVDYFNKGIALHYIPRAHYGFPQSAGCVEIPKQNARFLHKNIGYGTIVTVIGSAGNAGTKKQKENGGGKASTGKSCTE